MRVLLIQGWLGENPPDALVYPLGLSYVATALDQAGHQVTICDPNALPEGLAAVAETCTRLDPDVVGVSLRNIDTTDYLHYHYYYRHLDDVLDTVTRSTPGSLLIIGGTGFSIFPKRIMEDHPEIDFGLVRESETSVVDLLDHLDEPDRVGGVWIRDENGLRHTGDRPLPSYPDITWPRRDFCEITPYLAVERAIGIQSYRGCPLKCAYCNYPALNGKRIRTRTARDVVDEIEHLHRDLGVKEVIFADSLFDLKRSFAREICEELIHRDLGIRWSAWYETWRFDEAWFHLARQAGCYRFCFSPDGASDVTMKALGKRCRQADVERVLDIAARHPDTAFRFTLFCGSRGQDWLDVWRSIRFVVLSHLWLANSRCLLSWTRVFPDSHLYQDLVASGELEPGTDLLPRHIDNHRRLFHIAPESPRLATPLMRIVWQSAEMLRQARKRTPRLSKRLSERIRDQARARSLTANVARSGVEGEPRGDIPGAPEDVTVAVELRRQ
jgi:anaerobic magnesium-protoporphyrin IX monomethyl ester cyclase